MMLNEQFATWLATRAFGVEGAEAWTDWQLHLSANDVSELRMRATLDDVQELTPEQCPGYAPIDLGAWSVGVTTGGLAYAYAEVNQPVWTNTSESSWGQAIRGLYVSAMVGSARQLAVFWPQESSTPGPGEQVAVDGDMLVIEWAGRNDGSLDCT